MAKVYLPLASAEAFGAFGDVIVYQGVTCRSYVVPADPRTDLQISQREVFYDVTKMIRFMGLWARSAWRTVFGPRWYTSLYKRITENGLARLIAADAEWDAFTQTQKDDWNSAAPFQVTFQAPGTIFYAIMKIQSEWLTEKGAPNFGYAGVTPGGAATAGAWAIKDLSDALTAGKYDDDHAAFNYSGTWSTPAEEEAYGLSYHLSSLLESDFVEFYFYGSQISFIFEKGSGRGVAKVSSFGMADQLVDQNSVSAVHQAELLMPVFSKSLHYVRITRTGTGMITFDALAVSASKKKTKIDLAVNDYFQIPGVSLGRSANFSLSGTAWHLLTWDVEGYDTYNMHDLNVGPGRVTVNAAGLYLINIALPTFINAGNIMYMEVRRNGVVLLKDVFGTANSGGKIFTGIRMVELLVNDYIEVYVKQLISGICEVRTEVGAYPFLDVQMVMRESLKIGEVNVTVS